MLRNRIFDDKTVSLICYNKANSTPGTHHAVAACIAIPTSNFHLFQLFHLLKILHEFLPDPKLLKKTVASRSGTWHLIFLLTLFTAFRFFGGLFDRHFIFKFLFLRHGLVCGLMIQNNSKTSRCLKNAEHNNAVVSKLVPFSMQKCKSWHKTIE